MSAHVAEPKLYGLMAEFSSPEAIIEAANRVREAGYKRTDAFSPFPVHGLDDALGATWNPVAWIVLGGGLTGCLTGYLMQWWINMVQYPLNIGGRPQHSWVAFIPITFELTILFSAFAAIGSMILLNGLPQPYHPVFNVERFALASKSHFFLLIESTDEKFDADKTRSFLKELNANDVYEVEP